MKEIKILIIRLICLIVLIFSFKTNVVLADGADLLGPASIPIAQDVSGVAAAGVGLMYWPRVAGEGSIQVPQNATVKQVILYWEGSDNYGATNGDDTITIVNLATPGNEISVTGQIAGLDEDFYRGHGYTFRADITDEHFVQPGKTDFEIKDIEFEKMQDGAGIIVLYDDGSGVGHTDLRDGFDYGFIGAQGNPDLNNFGLVTYNFPAANYDRSAAIWSFFGNVEGDHSGEDRPTSVEIYAGSQFYLFSDRLHGSDGYEWDTYKFDFIIPAGADTVTMQPFSRDDNASGYLPASFIWVLGALNIPNANPVCDAGGPYASDCDGEVTTIELDASDSYDPDGDALSYEWWSDDCTNYTIDDPYAMKTKIHFSDPGDGKAVNCNINLRVSSTNGSPEGVNSSTCSAPIIIEACEFDCLGVPNGTATFDVCGVCDGDGTSCLDCLGVPFGGAEYDLCGVCEGNNECLDCLEIPFGPHIFDGENPAECCLPSDIDACNKCFGNNECQDNCENYDFNLHIQTLSETWLEQKVLLTKVGRRQQKYCRKLAKKSGNKKLAFKKDAKKARELKREIRKLLDKVKSSTLVSLQIEHCPGDQVSCPDLFNLETSDSSVSDIVNSFKKIAKRLLNTEIRCRNKLGSGKCEEAGCKERLIERIKQRKVDRKTIRTTNSVAVSTLDDVPPPYSDCFKKAE